MGFIKELLSVNYVSVFISIFVIIFGIVSIVEIISKFSAYIGKPFKWVKGKNNDHDIIKKITKTIDEIKEQQDIDREQSIKHDKIIKDNLGELSDVFFQKMLEDMRWRILDFASAISNGRTFNRESYDFILRTYDRYEEILKKKQQTNGLIDETIIYIRKKYQEYLQKGEL